jgi:Glycosyltransferase family 87
MRTTSAEGLRKDSGHRGITLLATVIVLGSIVALIAFSVIGVGRGKSAGFAVDLAYLYAAGRTWLGGGNPHNHAALIQSMAGIGGGNVDESAFAYPPQAAFLCIPLALLSYPLAKVAILVLNFGALAAIVAMILPQVRQRFVGAQAQLQSAIVTAFILGNPFTSHVIWLGQTTLIALAAVMASWQFSQRRAWVWSGIFLGLASFKPQTAALLFVWFILERRWKLLIVATGTMTFMSLYPMATHGAVGMLQDWFQGFTEYQQGPLNKLGVYHVIGLENLLYAAGLRNLPPLKILCLVALVGLWACRHRFNSQDVIALIMLITLSLVYGHAYDYACLIPALTALWLYAQRPPSGSQLGESPQLGQRRLGIQLVVVLLILSYFIPQRYVILLGSPLLEQWRTISGFLTLGLLLVMSCRWTASGQRRSASAATTESFSKG